MGKHDRAHELAALAAELHGAPHDLGTWWRLAVALADAGKADEAAISISELGSAASELGQVALAVACARWLAERKDAERAAALTKLIAHTHAAGSARIDRSSRPRPPSPPKQSGKQPAAVPAKNLDDAVARAEAAVEVAVAAAHERAGDKLAPTPLISALSAADVEQLIGVTVLAQRAPGDAIVKVGDKARTLFWLARGAVEVTRDGDRLGELRGGAFFGEIALLAGTTRTANVTCTEACWVLEIPKAEVERVAAAAPHVAQVLAEYARTRLLANVMRTSELFQRLDDGERKLLLPRFEARLVAAGTKIVEQSSDNEALHVVVSGRCAVRVDGKDVAELTAGDGFGESSLVRRTAAAADVVALEPTVTLSLHRQQFDDVAIKHPELLAEVYKLLVEREQANASGSLVHDASDLII